MTLGEAITELIGLQAKYGSELPLEVYDADADVVYRDGQITIEYNEDQAPCVMITVADD